jgi:hypothetical protein
MEGGFRVHSVFETLLKVLLNKTIVVGVGICIALVIFKIIEVRALIREFTVSFEGALIISFDVLLFSMLFFLLLLFLFLLGPFALLNLLVQYSFHFASFPFKLRLLIGVKLFGKGAANVTLFLKLLGSVIIKHAKD